MLSNELFLGAPAVGLLVVLAGVARWRYAQRAILEANDIVIRLETFESDLYHADRNLRRAVQLFRTARFKQGTGQRADPVRAAKALLEAYRLRTSAQNRIAAQARLARQTFRRAIPETHRGHSLGRTAKKKPGSRAVATRSRLGAEH